MSKERLIKDLKLKLLTPVQAGQLITNQKPPTQDQLQKTQEILKKLGTNGPMVILGGGKK